VGQQKQNSDTAARPQLPTLPCACANLRRAARAITRFYNRELRKARIEITQLTLLMTFDQAGEVTQGKLAKLLGLDSTSLTRMLAPLTKRGWIQEKQGNDRRFRLLQLTAAGRARLQQAMPHWRRAQDRLAAKVGEQFMGGLGKVSTRIAGSLSEA
jgi:DNA-binding MarR family transcriptional regulator